MDLNHGRPVAGGITVNLAGEAALAARQRTGTSRELTAVRRAMSTEVECLGAGETAAAAAARLAERGVGALPVCDATGAVKGVVTDRDIVVKVLAQGEDPAKVTAGELCEGEPVTVAADDSLEYAARKMREHKLRRLPVTDGHQVIGLVTQADLAVHLPPQATARLLESISTAPPDRGAGAWLFERSHR